MLLPVMVATGPRSFGGDLIPAECRDCQKATAARLPRAPYLDATDELVALESVHVALSEVADGSSYVWHRSHGRLSGLVRPVRSFKDAAGRVCRYVFVMLNGLDGAERTEGVACRLPTGVWQLEG